MSSGILSQFLQELVSFLASLFPSLGFSPSLGFYVHPQPSSELEGVSLQSSPLQEPKYMLNFRKNHG